MSPECVIAEDHNCPHAITCGSPYGIVYSVAEEVHPLLKKILGLIGTHPTWEKDGFIYACKPEKTERSEIRLETEAESGR